MLPHMYIVHTLENGLFIGIERIFYGLIISTIHHSPRHRRSEQSVHMRVVTRQRVHTLIFRSDSCSKEYILIRERERHVLVQGETQNACGQLKEFTLTALFSQLINHIRKRFPLAKYDFALTSLMLNVPQRSD